MNTWPWLIICRMEGYYYFRPPLIDKPPDILLPDPDIDPDWYGNIWIRYPSSPTPFPIQIGHNTRTKAQIMVILNDIATLYFGKGESQKRTIENAFMFKSILDDWFSGLPDQLNARNIIYPVQFHNQ